MTKQKPKPLREVLLEGHDIIWIFIQGHWEWIAPDKETDGLERFMCRAGSFAGGNDLLLAVPAVGIPMPPVPERGGK